MTSPSASTPSDDYCLLDCHKTLSLSFRARPGTDQADVPGDDDIDSDDGLVYVSRPESVRSLDTPPPTSPGIMKQNEHVAHDDFDTVMLDQPPACQSSWKQSGFNLYASCDYHPQPKLAVPGAGVLVPQLSLCPWPTASEQKPNSNSTQVPQCNSDANKHTLPTCDDHRSFDKQIMDLLIEHALKVRAEACLDAKTPEDKRLKEEMFNRLLDLPPDHPVLAEIFRHTGRNGARIYAWQNYEDEVQRKHIYKSIFTDVEKVALWFLTRTHAEHFAVACVFTDISVDPHTGPPLVSQDFSVSAAKQLATDILFDCLKPIEICNLLTLRGSNELRKWSWTHMIAKTREFFRAEGNDYLQQFNAHVDLLRRGELSLRTAEVFFAIRIVFMGTLQTLLISEDTANLSNALHGSPRQACATSTDTGATVFGESLTKGRNAIKRGASSTDFGYDGSPASPPAKRPNLPLTAALPIMLISGTPSTTCNPRTYSRQELCEKLTVNPELRHEFLELLVQKMGRSAKTTSPSTDSSSNTIPERCQQDHKLGSLPMSWSFVKDCCPLQDCPWSNPTPSTKNTLSHVKSYHPEFSQYLLESVNKALKAAQGPAVLRSTHASLSQYSAQTAQDPDIAHPNFSGTSQGMPNDSSFVGDGEMMEQVSRILDDCIRCHGISRTTTRGKVLSDLPTIPYRAWKSMLALEDYQVQLMLLEEQNKKRLWMSRNIENTENDSTSSVAGRKGEANAHHPNLAQSPTVKFRTNTRTKTREYEMQLKLLEEQNRRRLLLRRKEKNSGSDLGRSAADEKDEADDHHVNSPLSFSLPSNRKPPVKAQDYQKQLQLLEQQNKKRLLMARTGRQLDNDTSEHMEKRGQQASTRGGRHFQQTVASDFELDLVSFSDSDSHSDYESSECDMHHFVEQQDKNTLTSATIHQDEAAINSTAAQARSSPKAFRLHAVSKPFKDENDIAASPKSMGSRTKGQLFNMQEKTPHMNLYPSQALPLRLASIRTSERTIAERDTPNLADFMWPSVLREQQSEALNRRDHPQDNQKAAEQPSQHPEGVGGVGFSHPKFRAPNALPDQLNSGSSRRQGANTNMPSETDKMQPPTARMHLDGQYRPPEQPHSSEAAELLVDKFGKHYSSIKSARVQSDDEQATSEYQAKSAESLDALKMIASMCPTDLPIWRYRENGVLWLSFTTDSRGMEMEYTIRADVESVNVDILTPQFKMVHRLTTNKPSVCPMGELCNEDNCLFSVNHRLRQTRAWQLASLNPLLRNNSALLSEATARYFTFRYWYLDRKSPAHSNGEPRGPSSLHPLSYEAQLQSLENQCSRRHNLARQE